MYCPRCGRPVNTEANFCGGCGLSKVEIEKYLQKTQPQQPVQQPQPEEPKAEPVFTQPEEPKAEPVFTEPEAVKEEKTVFEQIKETMQAEPTFAETEAAKEAQTKAEYTAPNYNQYGYSQQNTAANTAGYTAPAEETKPEIRKEVPLSTVDFIWMMVIASLPVINIIYIIYLAVQDNNINKRSYARATLIIALFSCIIALVFGVGVIAAGLF